MLFAWHPETKSWWGFTNIHVNESISEMGIWEREKSRRYTENLKGGEFIEECYGILGSVLCSLGVCVSR